MVTKPNKVNKIYCGFSVFGDYLRGFQVSNRLPLPPRTLSHCKGFCPGAVRVHKGLIIIVISLFKSHWLAVVYCLVLCSGSCEPVKEDRTLHRVPCFCCCPRNCDATRGGTRPCNLPTNDTASVTLR